ncbi:hypothetical protein ACLX1H_008622 [Fusarium chlamydosporum]
MWNETTLPSSLLRPGRVADILTMSDFKRMCVMFILAACAIIAGIVSCIVVLIVWSKTDPSRSASFFYTRREPVSEPIKCYTRTLNSNINVLSMLKGCLMFNVFQIHGLGSKNADHLALGLAYMCYVFLMAALLFQTHNLWCIAKDYEPPRDDGDVELNILPPLDHATEREHEYDSNPTPTYAPTRSEMNSCYWRE